MLYYTNLYGTGNYYGTLPNILCSGSIPAGAMDRGELYSRCETQSRGCGGSGKGHSSTTLKCRNSEPEKDVNLSLNVDTDPDMEPLFSAMFHFLKSKRHHHERRINPVSEPSQQLNRP